MYGSVKPAGCGEERFGADQDGACGKIRGGPSLCKLVLLIAEIWTSDLFQVFTGRAVFGGFWRRQGWPVIRCRCITLHLRRGGAAPSQFGRTSALVCRNRGGKEDPVRVSCSLVGSSSDPGHPDPRCRSPEVAGDVDSDVSGQMI